MSQPPDFLTIRSWDGSQHRAFEELAYQLREPAPAGATEVKTGDPDAGVEWYVEFANGEQWGWQAKYSFSVEALLAQMRSSVEAVAKKRPGLRRLTFCIPIDLPEDIRPPERIPARERFRRATERWREQIEGADKIEFDLVTAGQLLERLTRADNRGMQWFWWQSEVFSLDWCRQKLDETIAAAGPRYTPELHVELPIGTVLQGLAVSQPFQLRYRQHRAKVLRAANDLARAERGSTPFQNAYDAMLAARSEWLAVAHERAYGAGASIPYEALVSCTCNCLATASLVLAAARQELRDLDQTDTDGRSDDEHSVRRARRDELDRVVRYVQRYERALDRFSAFLGSPTMLAAHRRSLFITGVAGQGKTHLLCDAASEALANEQPALVLLGQRFGKESPWTQIAAQLGLGQVGGEVAIGAMEAAAEASNGRFLFFVDALNESEDPALWRRELRVLHAQLSRRGWIGFAATCRTSYVDVVVPAEGIEDLVARVEHHGFGQRETEAVTKFFGYFGLEQPRIPFLVPEFSNPLFLKLYCEGLSSLGLTAPPGGHLHLTGVFDRFVASRARRVDQELQTDPADHLLEKAVRVLAQRMADTDEYLPYLDARALIDAMAPVHARWPTTLFGLMLSEGVLRRDRVYLKDRNDPEDAVGFAYQRFSDHLIAAALLDAYPAAGSGDKSVAAEELFRERVRAGTQGLLEALSVQLPERAGVELLDAVGPAEDEMPRSWHRERWYRALLDSIVVRERTAFTDRTWELIEEAQAEHGLFSEVLEALLAVAPDPDHPMNAEFLHSALTRWSFPDRDAVWTRAMYHEWQGGGALDRLIWWAVHGPHPSYEPRVIELAAVPLVWMFTSPNRYARDIVTKALVQLLHARLNVFHSLMDRFGAVDDPYVLERLVVCAHGAILRGGAADPDGAARLARRVSEIVFDGDEANVQLLTRDAARGAVEWCVHHGLISNDLLERARPPHHSKPPKTPRSREWLEKTYERYPYDDDRPGYGKLFWSVFEGDFGVYAIAPKVERFSFYRHGEAIPEAVDKPDRVVRLRKREYERFLKSLSEEQLALLPASQGSQAEEPLEGFFGSLTAGQEHLLSTAYSVRRAPYRPDPKLRYPTDRAERWIFQRCIELGWTPERFGDFDKYASSHGRADHKPERFGKKYQWIALRELFARLVDNYQWRLEGWGASETYRGPWQIYGRDIDPTLVPALRATAEDEFASGPETFPPAAPDAWWVPEGPEYRSDDEFAPEWPLDTSDLPRIANLVHLSDTQGDAWIMVKAYLKWNEEVPDGEERFARTSRQLWLHLYPWLVKSGDERRLEAFLRKHTLMGRWMPEGGDLTSGPYLGEIPWAESCREYPPQWTQHGSGKDIPVSVLPFATDYMWESVTRDCSIEEPVHAAVPVHEVFGAGGLQWSGDQPHWLADGEVVVRYERAEGIFCSHSALLVRESWLYRVLADMQCGLVVGLLGEKQFVGGTFRSMERSPWLEINGRATYDGKSWRHGRMQATENRPHA